MRVPTIMTVSPHHVDFFASACGLFYTAMSTMLHRHVDCAAPPCRLFHTVMSTVLYERVNCFTSACTVSCWRDLGIPRSRACMPAGNNLQQHESGRWHPPPAAHARGRSVASPRRALGPAVGVRLISTQPRAAVAKPRACGLPPIPTPTSTLRPSRTRIRL
eukprot:m.892264 g.892264  ORF g.892264 m.892264 type:complete len:161 (+) comp23655_c0_seq1:36-518(+)